MSILTPNTVVQDRYRIVRLIGQGGMGAVYEAVDQRLGRRVALKQMLALGEHLSHQFEREARLLANLDHPALPHVSDHFTDAAGQFLVMDFIPGDDLAMLLAQRGAPFPLEQVLQWADQLLDALDYLHTYQPPIIHRDVKPHNLKLKANGHIMLLDFGLAKGHAAEMTRVTSDGSVVGHTPGFAPPEQMEGTGTDARSDLYALGATLHCLLTNAAPVEALSRLRRAVRHQPDPLRSAHELNPEVPQAISAVLAHALALEPDDRPASAKAMRHALHLAKSALAVPGTDEGETELEPRRPTRSGQDETELELLLPSGGQSKTGVKRKLPEPTLTNNDQPGGIVRQRTVLMALVAVVSLLIVAPLMINRGGDDGSADVFGAAVPAQAVLQTATTTPLPSTPTPEPTATPTFADSFSSNANGWQTESERNELYNGNRLITDDDKYRLEVTALQRLKFVHFWSIPNTEPVADFSLTVEAQRTEEPSTGYCSLVFRFQKVDETDGNYYTFDVSDDSFRVGLWYNREWEELIKWTPTLAIRRGEVNQLKVITEGDHFRFYINDQKVDEWSDERLSSGSVGVAIGLDNPDPDDAAIFEFDNFELRASQPPVE